MMVILLLGLVIIHTFAIYTIDEKLEVVDKDNNNQNTLLNTLLIANVNAQLSTNIVNNSKDNSKHEKSFDQLFQNLFNQTRSLSFAYQDQVGRWESGIIDNSTMIQITKNYNSEYEDLIQQSKTMQKQLNQIIPNNTLNTSAFNMYEDILGTLTKAVELELESNKHFANYISSGNQSENQRSIDFLSQAYISENQMLDSYKSLPWWYW